MEGAPSNPIGLLGRPSNPIGLLGAPSINEGGPSINRS